MYLSDIPYLCVCVCLSVCVCIYFFKVVEQHVNLLNQD